MRQEECVSIVLRRFDAPDGDPTEPGSYPWNFSIGFEPNLARRKKKVSKVGTPLPGSAARRTASRPRLTFGGAGERVK